MEDTTVISIDEFCSYYRVPLSFLKSLEEIELIELVSHHEDETLNFVKVSHLKHIEKLIRLHFELDINLAGLDVVNNLLVQILELQEENRILKNRLGLFE